MLVFNNEEDDDNDDLRLYNDTIHVLVIVVVIRLLLFAVHELSQAEIYFHNFSLVRSLTYFLLCGVSLSLSLFPQYITFSFTLHYSDCLAACLNACVRRLSIKYR